MNLKERKIEHAFERRNNKKLNMNLKEEKIKIKIEHKFERREN